MVPRFSIVSEVSESVGLCRVGARGQFLTKSVAYVAFQALSRLLSCSCVVRQCRTRVALEGECSRGADVSDFEKCRKCRIVSDWSSEIVKDPAGAIQRTPGGEFGDAGGHE